MRVHAHRAGADTRNEPLMAPPAGTRLGHYEIRSTIGVGGMGEVYRAYDTTLGRDVALKVLLPPSLSSDPARLVRFEREARAGVALSREHRGHLRRRASTETCALVLELVEGPTLEDRILEGRIPIAEAIRIASQIAEAIEQRTSTASSIAI